tara:strand:- start:53 stop:787 length:735 start_codon:yes stop_codon:yes gene_type:complete
MKKFVCLIPCFNEGDNLRYLCDEIKQINNQNVDWYIINNGSTDIKQKDFEKVIENKINTNNVFTHFVKKNEGYGYGIKHCLLDIIDHYEFICWTHADGQTPLSDVINAFKIAEKKNNKNLLIKGIRKKRSDGALATFFTFFLNLIQIIFFSHKIISPNSQPTLITNKLLKAIIDKTFDDNLFDTSISIICAKIGCEIIRFPVCFLLRKNGVGQNEKIIQKLRFSIKNFILLWKMKKYSIFGRNL